MRSHPFKLCKISDMRLPMPPPLSRLEGDALPDTLFPLFDTEVQLKQPAGTPSVRDELP